MCVYKDGTFFYGLSTAVYINMCQMKLFTYSSIFLFATDLLVTGRQILKPLTIW